MNLNKTKIRIKDKEHYELVQDALYDKEIYWINSSHKRKYDFNFGYLYIDYKFITWSDHESGNKYPHKEITLEDILACEIQYEIY
jgi:hypothetical protein